jgi:ubiquinol-cytochrome c reductase iron-sulfur subunit
MSTHTDERSFDVEDPRLTRFDLVKEGARRDGVEIVHYEPRFPVPGTRRERRITRALTLLFLLAGLLGTAFVVAYIWWPWQYAAGTGLDKWYTPVLGLSMGLALAAIGIGMIAWGKKLLPEEIAVQERHDGPSDATEAKLTGETMVNMADELGVRRRPLLGVAALAGMVPLGLVIGVPLVGGLIRNPHKGPNGGPLMYTGWDPDPNQELFPDVTHTGPPAPHGGQMVALARDDGTKIRPEDVSVGGQMTVFPALYDTKTGEFVGNTNAFADSPTLLIHLRDEDAARLRRNLPDVPLNENGVDGQPNVWGNYVAYSKICTHAGCPASLYEQQTNRLLCPCHQSQFLIIENGRPIFGPATRRLPMLPLTVQDGFFYAAGDYQVPVGPGFWERP